MNSRLLNHVPNATTNRPFKPNPANTKTVTLKEYHSNNLIAAVLDGSIPKQFCFNTK